MLNVIGICKREMKRESIVVFWQQRSYPLPYTTVWFSVILHVFVPGVNNGNKGRTVEKWSVGLRA